MSEQQVRYVTPFSFLRNDILTQVRVSKELAAEANRINQDLANPNLSKEEKDRLERVLNSIVRAATDIAENADSVSSTASTVITTVSSSST